MNNEAIVRGMAWYSGGQKSQKREKERGEGREDKTAAIHLIIAVIN